MKFIGQKTIRVMMENAIKSQKLPSSLLVVGPDSHGKSTFVLEMVRDFYTQIDPSFEFKKLYSYEHFIPIRSDDRMVQMQFLYHLAQQSNGSNKQDLLDQLYVEMSDILSRHQKGFLLVVKDKKASYAQGVKLTDKQLEDLYFECFEMMKKVENGEILHLNEQEVLGAFEKLQNSLDRSLLTSSCIEKIVKTLEQVATFPRIIFIEQIEKIGSNQMSKLLKVLEDTPPNVYFILSSTGDVSKALASGGDDGVRPLYSRCFKLMVRQYAKSELREIFSSFFGLSVSQVFSNVKQTQLHHINAKNSQYIKFQELLNVLFSENSEFTLKKYEEILMKVDTLDEDVLFYIGQYLQDLDLDIDKKNKILRVLNEIKIKMSYNLTKSYHLNKIYGMIDLLERRE